ncbi:hypothetical protein BB559_000038 [Furculomyces boomerangus]|uniref:Activator of Hsp90 ATPase AHSA1-like N-terminal domain-containing protein n=2 Tax=Harpellales TaxID=61421 RepID=A0A2T9Z6I2_9FUNG|nr:hypothetical protein BB559_000038 [Furculomyces boomerangus]PWA01368.1 hypothetical protein BB558_002536 [Smittium angustum]
MTQSNWKNVNNWHWTEKNCFDWSEKYFKETLPKVSLTKGDFAVCVSSVDSVSGDVDLNQRKGKIITLFDLELVLKWEGKSTNSEKKSTGTITIPEVAHDTDSDDYVFDVRVDGEDKDAWAMKELVRTELSKKLVEEFQKFPSELIKQNLGDVYINNHGSSGDAKKPIIKSSADKDNEHPHVKAFKAGESGLTLNASFANMNIPSSSIKMEVEFMTSAKDLFDALVNPAKVSVWSRAPAIISSEPNKSFELFSKNIIGKNIIVDSPKTIKQNWRISNWVPGHFSTVTMEIIQGDSSTKLKLEQTGVPKSEVEATELNWDRYYWTPIKNTFGWGFSV